MANTEMTDRLRPTKKEVFIENYALHGVVTVACAAASISRSCYYQWCENDEDFAIACEDARECAVDLAEFELRNRAVDGVEEPVLFKGEPVWRRDPVTADVLLDDDFNPIPFTINRRSDRLLEVYMKANRNQYRDKGSLEVTGKDGGAIETQFEVTYVLPSGKTEEDYKVIEHQQDERALGYAAENDARELEESESNCHTS